ncbi:hypothetical protein [Leptospira adleri]|uniref:hypothetical protein n=1 Tax=Leptospira adleri TaxID=2023186 RepID=UPI00108364F9|nr:hypothetical protein [Leptospira adleri]TGM53485.1 hypothetical protein EHQ97_16565 [Leptospira adleri]
MKKIWILGTIIALFFVGCKPCSNLEARICSDLGEKCEKWKSLGKPGLPNDSHDENRRKKLFTVLAESVGLIEKNAQMCQGLTANYDKLIESLKGSVK